MISDKTLKRVRWWVWFGGVLAFFMLVGMCRSVMADTTVATYTPRIINMKPAAGAWVPATADGTTIFVRNVPTVVKSGVLTKILNSKLTLAQLAILSTSMMYQAVKDQPELFPETKAWLQSMGVDMGVAGGEYKYRYKVQTAKTGSAAADCLAQAEATINASPSPTIVQEFSNLNDSMVWYESILFVGSGSAGIGQKCNPGSSMQTFYGTGGCKVYWRKFGPLTNYTFQCDYAGETCAWKVPYNNNVPFATDQFVEEYRTDKDIGWDALGRLIDKAITGVPLNVPVGAQKSIDEMLNKLADALANNSTMLDKNADSTTKLREKLETILKQGIGNPALDNMETESTAGGESGTDLTDTFNDSSTTTNNTSTTNNSTGGEEEEDTSVYSPSAPLGPYEKDHDLSTRTQQFWDDLKQTGLVTMITGFSNAVPSGGSCEISFDGGIYGSHTYSFCDWTGVFAVLRAVTLIIAGYIGLRIVTKGGAG